jgi:hypothetical protein
MRDIAKMLKSYSLICINGLIICLALLFIAVPVLERHVSRPVNRFNHWQNLPEQRTSASGGFFRSDRWRVVGVGNVIISNTCN